MHRFRVRRHMFLFLILFFQRHFHVLPYEKACPPIRDPIVPTSSLPSCSLFICARCPLFIRFRLSLSWTFPRAYVTFSLPFFSFPFFSSFLLFLSSFSLLFFSSFLFSFFPVLLFFFLFLPICYFSLPRRYLSHLPTCIPLISCLFQTRPCCVIYFVYLFIYLFIYISIYLSIYLFIYLFICFLVNSTGHLTLSFILYFTCVRCPEVFFVLFFWHSSPTCFFHILFLICVCFHSSPPRPHQFFCVCFLSSPPGPPPPPFF